MLIEVNMSNQYLIDEIDKEREIANVAARVLQECFIEAKQNGPVLYVENDVLVSTAPNGEPTVVKHLYGRNPAHRVVNRGTFKIKKRQVED